MYSLSQEADRKASSHGARKSGSKRLLGHVAAHPSGLTHIRWSTDGKHLITGGCDGKVLIATAPSKGGEARTIRSIEDHNEPVTAIAVSPSGKHFASAGEDHIVKLYSYPDGKFESNVTRFTLPVRALAFSATGGTLATGGDDEGIRLVSVADASVSQVLKGHNGSVSSLSFDPQHTLLGSSASDGAVLVHDLEAGKIVHRLNGLAPKGETVQGYGNTVDWHPDGDLLALPGPDNEILVLDRVSGDVAFSLSGAHTDTVVTLAWSPNGRYLASAAKDQMVFIWDMTKKEDLARYAHSADVSSLAWRPGGNDLAIADWEGKYGVWETAIPSHLPGPCSLTKPVEAEGSLHFSMDDSEEDKDSQKNNSKGLSENADMDEDEDEDEGVQNEEVKRAVLPKRSDKKVTKEAQKAELETRVEYVPAKVTLKMQPAFQPGGTILISSRRHFLVYNMLGCVIAHQEEGHATVQVEFHDTSRGGGRLPVMTDFFGFTMAALGEVGAVLASPKRGDTSPSALMFRPLSSWAANSEWTVRFPENEEVQAIALGSLFCAVATSSNMLRIFSLAGVQRFVSSVSGPVVCLATHGSRLAVVTQAGAPLPDGSQVLEVVQWEVTPHAFKGPKSAPLRLSLSPGASLTWLGYTEEGQLATYDSQGVLRVSFEEMGNCWVPLFSSSNERKSPTERHWVVGVGDKDLYCILCKAEGPESQPQVTPRPVLRLLPLSVPLLPGEGSPLEEESVRLTLQLTKAQAQPDREDEILELETVRDKNLVRQMAAACSADRAVRALEVAGQLVLHKSLEGALRLASTLRMSALSERIGVLLQDRLEEQSSHRPPVQSTTPIPSSRPFASASATPTPEEPQEDLTPTFTPAVKLPAKPAFTPDTKPQVKMPDAKATPSGKQETPSTVLKAGAKALSTGNRSELKANPFAKRTAAPEVKLNGLMSAMSSGQKQQEASAALGLKRKGGVGSNASNVAKAPKR